jgi:hypothetical protein
MDEIQKKILRLILQNGQIRGFELKQEIGVDGAALAGWVGPLIERGLITASGPIHPETIDRVQFAPLSSAVERKSLLL